MREEDRAVAGVSVLRGGSAGSQSLSNRKEARMRIRVRDEEGKYTPAEIRAGKDVKVPGNLLEIEDGDNRLVGAIDESGRLLVEDVEHMVRVLKALK